MKKTCMISLLLFMAANAFGQVPQGINYQAVIRNNAGNVLSGQIVEIRIHIREGTITGNAVYTETHSTFTNTYGLVNLIIGEGSVMTGVFSAIDWGGNSHFVEIEADVTGGTNYQTIGAQQLMSVPYALYAESTGQSYQTLSLNGDTLSISNGNSIILPNIKKINTLLYTIDGF